MIDERQTMGAPAQQAVPSPHHANSSVEVANRALKGRPVLTIRARIAAGLLLLFLILLLASLLDFARKSESRLEPLDLGGVVEAGARLAQNQLNLKGVRLNVSVAAHLADQLRDAGFALSISGLNDAILEVITWTRLLEKVGRANLYRNVASALASIHARAHASGQEKWCPLLQMCPADGPGPAVDSRLEAQPR